MRKANLLSVSREGLCIHGGLGRIPLGLPTGRGLGSPPTGHVTYDACWEANPTCEQMDRCKNIALPQTSFPGGNYVPQLGMELQILAF